MIVGIADPEVDVRVFVSVVALAKPLIVPVPPVLVIFPVLAIFVALTNRPLIVIISVLLVPEVV